MTRLRFAKCPVAVRFLLMLVSGSLAKRLTIFCNSFDS